MTSTISSSNSNTRSAPSSDDPRLPFTRSIATARTVLAALDGTNATDPSPCPDWNAGQIGAHLVAVLDRVAALPAGRPVDGMPLLRDDLDTGELLAAFDVGAQTIREAWTRDVLGQMVIVPWATLPGAVAMAIYSAEVLIHTWDLAVAIGVEPQWHEPDVALAADTVRMGVPAEPRAVDDMPFAHVVPTPDDAPAIHHLVAWMGRDPRL